MSPVTRLRTAAPEPGWLKVTLFGWPIEKLSQLTIAFWEDWVIVRLFPCGAPMLAAPDTIEPPRGKTLWRKRPRRWRETSDSGQQLYASVALSSTCLRGGDAAHGYPLNNAARWLD